MDLHENPAFDAVPHPQPQTEKPIASFEGHLSHDFKPGTWASLDGNFWWGGLTSLSGIQRLATKQVGSRLGGTFAWRFAKHQSMKLNYSFGTFSRFGGNYQSVAVAWQHSWLGWPRKAAKNSVQLKRASCRLATTGLVESAANIGHEQSHYLSQVTVPNRRSRL